MSIDKFGRILRNEESNILSLKKEVKPLTLSFDGHYDAEKKRIKNLATPVFEKDAANVEYVDKKFGSCLKVKVGGFYDAKNYYIRKIRNPVEKDDAVNKQYLESLIPIKLIDGYSLGNLKLQDVAYPTNPGDGVNMQYVTNTCVTYENGIINAKNSIIKHIQDGKEDTDAASISYVKKAIDEYNATVEKYLRSLGSALFHYIHRASGRASETGISNINYLDWNKIIM